MVLLRVSRGMVQAVSVRDRYEPVPSRSALGSYCVSCLTLTSKLTRLIEMYVEANDTGQAAASLLHTIQEQPSLLTRVKPNLRGGVVRCVSTEAAA